MLYRIDGIAEGSYGGLSAERFVALCERTFAYQGSMRALAEAQAEEGDDAGPPVEVEDEDEEEPQELDGLNLPMEVRGGQGQGGDGARVAG